MQTINNCRLQKEQIAFLSFLYFSINLSIDLTYGPVNLDMTTRIAKCMWLIDGLLMQNWFNSLSKILLCTMFFFFTSMSTMEYNKMTLLK